VLGTPVGIASVANGDHMIAILSENQKELAKLDFKVEYVPYEEASKEIH
jgi:hypothetical protein